LILPWISGCQLMLKHAATWPLSTMYLQLE